jgi:GrpB-like predicted nucleotidyltransferase (UPF0157 family)
VTADAPIEIVPYDASWPWKFEEEKERLRGAIGPWAVGGIHHVGSTAVPGLDAKPVIDILVGVESLEASRACFDRLRELDYQYAPYRADEMHWFCKPNRAHRTHHLHLSPVGSKRYREEVAFRDALRAQPTAAREYAQLKRELADKHRNDREAYAIGKSEFIAGVLARA